MGNINQKSNSPVRRPSLAEREEIRARKKVILDALEFSGVPVDEQDATCKLLLDGGIDDTSKLLEANDTILASLGIKPSTREILINAKNKLLTINSAKPPLATTQNVMPPLDPSQQRRKKSIAAGGSLLDRGPTGRRESFRKSTPAPSVRLTKFIVGDQVEHYREADNLLRKGKVVGVHSDDPAGGMYYTVIMESGEEIQTFEGKIKFAGEWTKSLQDKGVVPRSPGDPETPIPVSQASTPIGQTTPAPADDDDIL